MHRKYFLRLSALFSLGLFVKPRKLFGNLSADRKLPYEGNNVQFKGSGVPYDGNDVQFEASDVQYFKQGDPEYDILRKGFNKRINKFPLVIALCKNTAGVAAAINYALQNKLPVTVKSGGHCMEGFSCNNGGMVINLSLLNTVEWVNGETVTVGPGCTLSNLYDILLPKGQIIPGGSCAGVGIGGLVLGGGYGLMARKLGLTCDSLVDITMVDGAGQIRHSSTDKELLWACKGGGNGNFGVITELTFKTHPAPATMQSCRFRSFQVDTERGVSILKKWFDMTAGLPVDCFSAYVLNGKTVYILLTNTGKHTAALQQAIDGLAAVSDKVTQTKPQPLAPALKVFYGQRTPQFFKNASAGLYKNFGEIEGCIKKVVDAVLTTPGMIYQVNTLGGNIINPAFEEAASFPHRACIYFSELQTYWQTEVQGVRLMNRFQDVQNIFVQHGIHTQYRNYPDINFANWESLYYGANYHRLQEVKNKYDPGNLFSQEQSVRNLPL